MVRGLLPKNRQKAMTKLFKNYPPQGSKQGKLATVQFSNFEKKLASFLAPV